MIFLLIVAPILFGCLIGLVVLGTWVEATEQREIRKQRIEHQRQMWRDATDDMVARGDARRARRKAK